jgi:hypothetical protein
MVTTSAVVRFVDVIAINMERDGDSESAALSLGGDHRELAAVQLHHLLAQREP